MSRCEEKGPGTSSSLCIVSELQLHLGSPVRPFGEGNESRSEGCADVIQNTYSPSCPIRGFVFIMFRSGPTPAKSQGARELALPEKPGLWASNPAGMAKVHRDD